MGIANTVSDGRGNRPFVLVGKDKMTKIESNLVIAGYVENICKQCGQKFEVAFYTDETEEAARKSYCLSCIMGLRQMPKEK